MFSTHRCACDYMHVYFGSTHALFQPTKLGVWAFRPQLICRHVLQIKMARPQVSTQQQPGAQFPSRGPSGGRGGYPARGGRGGRGGHDQYAYGQGQYGSGYGGYGYDAAGGYGYGDYTGYAGAQYGAGMQMVPMMLPSGQVRVDIQFMLGRIVIYYDAQPLRSLKI